MPFQIIRNDITKVKADIIVNTANPAPTFSLGTDTAIYTAAGAEELLAKRKEIGNIAMGDIAVTPAFKLPAKYIIHAVGPVWNGGGKGEFEILKSCYAKSLEKAVELDCQSIAFPLMAAGSNGFPRDKALQIALNEISAFLMRDDVELDVMLVVFTDKDFRLSKNLFFQVESFISDKEVIEAHLNEYGIGERELQVFSNRNCQSRFHLLESLGKEGGSRGHTDDYPISKKSFDEHSFDKKQFMKDGKAEHAFFNQLLAFMDQKELDSKTVYKRSNITKGAFSKIMCGDTKIPKKDTILALCIGMALSIDEATDLLASADMAFNPYDKRDLLIYKCIENEQYDMNEVNAMLFVCNQATLGG